MSDFKTKCGDVLTGSATGAALGGSIGAAIGACGGPVTSALGAKVGGAVGRESYSHPGSTASTGTGAFDCRKWQGLCGFGYYAGRFGGYYGYSPAH